MASLSCDMNDFIEHSCLISWPISRNVVSITLFWLLSSKRRYSEAPKHQVSSSIPPSPVKHSMTVCYIQCLSLIYVGQRGLDRIPRPTIARVGCFRIRRMRLSGQQIGNPVSRCLLRSPKCKVIHQRSYNHCHDDHTTYNTAYNCTHRDGRLYGTRHNHRKSGGTRFILRNASLALIIHNQRVHFTVKMLISHHRHVLAGQCGHIWNTEDEL